MPSFRFIAMDANGAETEGKVDADNKAQADKIIRDNGYTPIRVSEIGAGAATPRAKAGKGKAVATAGTKKKSTFFKRGIKPKHLMVFTRQLATLLEAGLPLLRGLHILQKQEKSKVMVGVLQGMGDAVESGGTFSEALGEYPWIFDDLFVNMVRAGEAGGVLDGVLARLAEFQEKAERIKAKVKSAMVYPIVVLIAALGILAFLMIFIIPKFAAIFNDLLGGRQLPGITRFVIASSDFFAHRWYVILGIIFGTIFLVKLVKRTEKGMYYMDMLKLKAPLFGSLFMKTAVARFARTLGTLMGSGVPVLQALSIVRDTSGNKVIADAIQVVHDSVKEGEAMALPMEQCGIFPGMVVSMVDVGEETGALPEMLVRVADNYDEEVDTAVEGLTSVIEPIMIIMLAFIIGTIVIAMFVPLISIISQMQ